MIYLILIAMILNMAYLTINIILNNNNIFDDDDFFYFHGVSSSTPHHHKYKEDCYPLYLKEYHSDF